MKQQLLEIGGEGGSITINKILVGKSYKYWFGSDESALADFLSGEDLEEISLSSKSDIVDSFEEAFANAQKKYPVFKLYLIAIDDEVKEYVTKEFKAYAQENMKAKYFHFGSGWKELLGIE